MIPIEHYLILASILFTIGVVGVLLRKNIVFMLMSLQLILNAANIIFVATSKFFSHLEGELMMVFILIIAACQTAVGLSIVICLSRNYGSLNSDFFKTLRG